MNVLRTPEDRFHNLPGYPFAPHQLLLPDGLRMHYVDEGPRSGPVILLLHGEPTWSYLYRKMIPPLAEAGYRVLAPDLIGFGKSDKPAALADYSYEHHARWVQQFIEGLHLRDATLFCQDWGSLLGLRIAGLAGERFGRIAVSNGFLPTARHPLPAAFKLWRAFALYSPWFPIGRIVQSGCVRKLTPQERAAYDAPFPTRAHKVAARAFPALVPSSEQDPAIPANRAAWHALGQWRKPFLTAFASRDPITRGADRLLQEHIPGAQGQPHTTVRAAGHFIQEDQGEALAQILIDWQRGLSGVLNG